MTETTAQAIVEKPYAGPERRFDWHTPKDCEKLLDVETRLNVGAERMRRIEEKLCENTEMTAKLRDDTAKLRDDTSEVVDLLRSFKGAFKVLEMIGKFAKPLGYIVALVGALYGLVAIVKGGGAPK